MAWMQMPWLNEVRWMGVAGYLQRNSSVWLESRSIPYLAAATVRAGWRLCHLALHGHREMERVWASSAALTPSLPPFSPGLIDRHQASPLCPAQKPWPRPGPASGAPLAQLPTMLKGQRPPATQPICQAADQSVGSERSDTLKEAETLSFWAPCSRLLTIQRIKDAPLCGLPWPRKSCERQTRRWRQTASRFRFCRVGDVSAAHQWYSRRATDEHLAQVEHEILLYLK